MYLSNRLTFSLFSVFLVVAFAFVATPAMAVTTVTAQVTQIVPPAAGPPIVQAKKVVTIKYSENADPAPVITAPDDTNLPVDADSDDDVLAVTKVDAKTYRVTIFAAADGTTVASIPTLTLTGYVPLTGLDTHVIDDTTPANSTNVVTPFVLNDNTLPGKGYAIIASYYTIAAEGTPSARIPSVGGAAVVSPAGGSYPTLPTNLGVFAPANLDGLLRRDWDDHFDADSTATDRTGDLMPDLWAHFQAGHRGTLDLTVVKGDGTPIDATFDPTATDATDRVGDANARTVVINEVMWARDNSEVGNIARLREQWIEIYNTKTTPVPLQNIRFTLSNAHPAPTNMSTDRLSTNPSFTSVWDITGKGQDGNAGATDGSGKVVFASMHRTKLDNGWTAGHWAKAGDLFLPNFQGTPGKANSLPGLPGARTAPGKDTPAKGTFVINEIGNMSNDKHDWIEIKNITGSPQSLKNWALSFVTTFNMEAEWYRFPEKNSAGQVINIPAGGVFLLVNEDPKTTDNNLARGFNLNVPAVDQDFGVDENISYLIVPNNKIAIPANNDWLLILRSGNPWNVKDGRNVYNTGFRVQDVAGAARIVRQDLNKASPAREKKADGAANGDIWHTTHFPLNGHNLGGDKILRHDRNLSANVWARNTGKQGYERHAFNQAGFTGIGYDRNVANNAANGGTPGYDNGIAKGKVADISGGALVISELMLATDNGRFPQWIELQNTSKTHGIHLAADATDPKHGWQIIIENYNSGTWMSNTRPLHVTINLKDWFSYIPPNQSVLIAAFVSSYSENLPENRVADVTMTKRANFKMAGRRDSFLNAEGGFYIKIIDGDGNVSDEVGNLDGVASNARAGIGIDAPVGFSWPVSMTDDGARISLIRLKNDTTRGGDGTMGTPGTARVGVPGMQTDEEGNPITDANGDPMYNEQGAVAPMGSVPGEFMDKKYAWIHASDLLYLDVPRGHRTWFGTSTDIGTPLHIAGTPLPVELSFFRPTLENGQVTIQWTTESELDNAGFNILRSDTRNGEFTQVNEQMIQGKGTTAERSSYKWVDTTAKPGAVYYYQIEDVSFAGEHNALATTKLKGLISAKGKLTTSWGDIKDASQ